MRVRLRATAAEWLGLSDGDSWRSVPYPAAAVLSVALLGELHLLAPRRMDSLAFHCSANQQP